MDFGNVWGLLVAVGGFGAIIFIHELGHFVAARWAGIRVYAFAVGFGPAAFAWRKGIGLRRGSTNAETLRVLRERLSEAEELPADIEKADAVWPADIGKTEYRLNWLPFGGYVQMRGQDDVNPGEAESARGSGDSFLDKPVWKRMVVISAGVVMNVILALVLYIAVYTIGKPASPAVVGGVQPGSPAESAVALNAVSAGVSEVGLKPGDEILSVNGSVPREFGDVWLEGALADPDKGLEMSVRRAGVAEELRFAMTPEQPEGADFASVGLLPAVSTVLAAPEPGVASAELNLAYLRERAGLGGDAERVVSIGGRPVSVLPELGGFFDRAGASAIPMAVEAGGREVEAVLRGTPELERAVVELGERPVEVLHVAGFVPPMQIGLVYRAADFGLRPGDEIVRIGRLERPGPLEGIRAIREAAGTVIEIEVDRGGGERFVAQARVGTDGTVGFYPVQALDRCVVTRALPAGVEPGDAGRRAGLVPGSIIETVDGVAVSDYAELRDALAKAAAGRSVSLGVLLPMGTDERATVEIELDRAEVDRLRGLGWAEPAYFAALFEPETTVIQASNPMQAIVMGVQDTHQMILRTYLTLRRLVEGTVQVDQLRGPVGIAHIGTQVAQRSFPELLFFFAVISANLAVLNFLPIPIADGGMMVFLIIEAITKKPVSPAVQNAAALVGLVLLGAVFLLVTFNDLTRLL